MSDGLQAWFFGTLLTLVGFCFVMLVYGVCTDPEARKALYIIGGCAVVGFPVGRLLLWWRDHQ